jgi:hypothetical protein
MVQIIGLMMPRKMHKIKPNRAKKVHDSIEFGRFYGDVVPNP